MSRLLVVSLTLVFASFNGCSLSESEPPPQDVPTIPPGRNGQEHLDKLKKPSTATSPLRYALFG
jgi:hypothetical protein